MADLQAERSVLLRRLAEIERATGMPPGDAALRELQASWQAILYALPAHIALLAPDGRIAVVNEAWRRFASANAFAGGAFGIGEDYLAVCADASGECAASMASATAWWVTQPSSVFTPWASAGFAQHAADSDPAVASSMR